MTNRTLLIKRLVRAPKLHTSDELELLPGVNVIVGRGNTGKTKWLQMLDYLLGDPGSPEEAFGDLAEKYNSVSALISISGEEFWIERRWHQIGAKGKVFVDNKSLSTEDFQIFLLEKLQIPIVHFPKGNPYEERNWPILSWRVIWRHIFRQQRFWGDLADKQPESEQHAVLMQFVGIAKYLFSEKSGELVQKRKQIWKLQGAREQYLSMLDGISREITDEKEFQVALTDASLETAITRIHGEVLDLQARREEVLIRQRELAEASTSDILSPDSSLDTLSEKWAKLQNDKSEYLNLISKADKRLLELHNYKIAISNEIARLERAQTAGHIFDGLKVTQCPVCDQAINHDHGESGQCFLCKQLLPHDQSAGDDRLALEITRLVGDLQEANDLIKQVASDLTEMKKTLRRIEEELDLTRNRLEPVRKISASLLSPEITVYDMDIGRLQERIRQLERIKVALNHYKSLSDEIDRLKKEESELKKLNENDNLKVNFEVSAEKLTDGMNTYLNALVASDNKLWTLPKVTAFMKERGFKFTVANVNWSSKLGGTLALYFLLSYHYGLLSLTTDLECNYPGIMVIDFPATLEDGSTIQDKENFIIEPFVSLLKKPGMEAAQAIITGAAFEKLKDVNRVEFHTVWK